MTCSAVLNLLDPKKFKVSGSVFFGKTDLLNSSEKQRRGIYGNQIVYIPQNPMTALDPSMRIGRQMDETLRLHSDKSRQQRYNYILRLLHDVGLDDPDRVYRAYPHMLSGGMLQRVIIAMAKQVLRSKIQLILQDGKGAMDPRFTVYQIIAEPIRIFRKLSKKEEEREINDLLTMMELPEEIKLRKAHELSGGQQKRVCIARALAAQPDVLIFDEAVSGLDVLVRKHILDLLKRLHQERKMTCFFITHDLDVALYLADRVMVMRCGKIIEDRTFHGSTDCFTHPYTKLLLHSIAPYLG